MVPCDSRLNVNTAWQPILPRGLPVGDRGDWIVSTEPKTRGVVSQPDSGRPVCQSFVAVHLKPPPRHRRASLKTLVVVAERLAPAHGRVEPHRNTAGRYGVWRTRGSARGGHRAVIDSSPEESLRADLALILQAERRDFAAVQISSETRLPTGRNSTSRYRGLPTILVIQRARSSFHCFLSGVSRPAGLPTGSNY